MDAAVKKQDYQQMLWDFMGIAWRRKFWVLIPLAIGIAVSVSLLFTLPKIYQSSTLILVEEQKVPQSVVESAVSGTAQDRLSTIKQQVLSRSFLMRVMERFNLYENEPSSFFQAVLDKIQIKQKPLSATDKLERMRKDIELKINRGNRLESFSISYMGRHPETVMNVTNELASLVIEENLRIREAFIEGATDFLDVELENLRNKLEAQEKRVGDYKRDHIGELPEQLDSNLRALDRFQATLETIQFSKKAVNDRILDLERTLKAVQGQEGAGTLLIESSVVDGRLESLPQSPLKRKLNEYKQSLSGLLMEYNETYPDVIILRRRIEELEKRVAESESNQVPVSGKQKKSESKEVPRDSGPTTALLLQIRSAYDELKDIEKREKDIKVQIDGYELRVENTPKREQELVTIQRDYDNVSASYQSLLSKKLNAEISENLEKRQKGEQFRVIDSADLPEKPIKPNKMMVLLLGSVMGLGAGIGLAFIREQLDNSIRKPEEVERITSVLVLAVIPDFEDEIRQYEKQRGQKVVDIEQFSDRKRYLRRGGSNK